MKALRQRSSLSYSEPKFPKCIFTSCSSDIILDSKGHFGNVEAVLKINFSNMAFFINLYEKLFPPVNKYGMKLADVRQAVKDGGNLLYESFICCKNKEDLKYKFIKIII